MDRHGPRDLCPGHNLNDASAAHDYRRALVHSRTVEHVIGHYGLEYWLNQWSALSCNVGAGLIPTSTSQENQLIQGRLELTTRLDN